MKDIDILEKLCPECIFKPEYPQVFKFDLVVNSKNYGEITLIIKENLELSEFGGNKKALDKLDDICKKQAGKAFYYNLPPTSKNFVKYPLQNARELISVLFQTQEITKDKGIEDLRRFVSKVRYPINEQLFYEKTGMRIER